MSELSTPHTITGAAHPDTSRVAAVQARPRTVSSRWQVLFALTAHAMTDEEMQQHLAMNPNTQRPRRIELVRAGLVYATTARRYSRAGSLSIVWTATVAGHRAVAQARCRP